ncbi:Triosephosphate isomerase [Grifola frondosa]|uniref:Triosephosphate isomerase n=1 Tax=Grifola frondosa TaxID=5627 RepID=A0A1C7MTQ0_GRIFR|nr:Triosephosphate isomerase [Grifola frondosa]
MSRILEIGSMPRQFFVGGNFKMNPVTQEQKRTLVKVLNEATIDPAVEVVIAPPALYIFPLKDILRKDIKVAAQNCYFKLSGAFTGEISPSQLVDAEIPYVILGHSERRTLFHESSDLVAQKTRAALDAGLSIILCVGETLEEREAGKTAEIVESQLKPVVGVLKEADWRFVPAEYGFSDSFTKYHVPPCSKIVIAYEPVWAIGTGKVATSAQAQQAHADIRSFLSTAVSAAVAENTRIIYGGSVNAGNCKELGNQKDVDGFLVGGASLKPEFVDIINAKKA